MAAFESGAWKKGTTKLGTAGTDQVDDLKLISGIGPQMEQLLNSFGITSFAQLADLDKDGVATVDAALTDFPGRIERDEWVPQARGLVGGEPFKKDRTPELEAQIKAKNKKIAELEKMVPESARRMAAFESGAWKKGKTKLGTPGAGHTDDLKLISGIGPQMEDLLNSFGITSFEQLADLDKDGVATVDAALTDFPGRIERDEWVPQARGLITGEAHAPKKRAPAKKKSPSWQKGKTKLGTPGAGHSDDLKVINGIGPKMEGILNSFGIQAWEQLAALKKNEVVAVNEALDFFPGRIERDDWVNQAKGLCKRFPDTKKRPTRKTFLNNSDDQDPFN